MPSLGSIRPQLSIGFFQHLTQRRVGCTWLTSKHRCLDPKVISDYKRATFEFQAKDVHPADQMGLHKQTREMIFHTLAHASASAAKYLVSLNNSQTQLKLEKISSFAKDNRIKTLEELVLKIGYDPVNIKATEEMIKKKNADIASLRK
jgi:hypothetical protein